MMDVPCGLKQFLFQMCCSKMTGKNSKVYAKYSTNGELCEEPVALHVPEHVDNPLLDRNVKNGILGFRYETQNSTIVVYSSIECKTFCYIVQLTTKKN